MPHFYEDVSNLNAPYDVIPVPGGGLGRALGSIDDPDYPWDEYSAKTAELQREINAKLRAIGACPLVVDGVLGGSTCGAGGYLTDGDVGISTCLNRANAWTIPNFPNQSGIPCKTTNTVTPTPEPTREELDEIEEKPGIPAWVIGLIIGAAAVGTAIYLKKRK